MLFLFALLLAQFGLTHATLEITGNGNPTFLKLWESLQSAYKSLLGDEADINWKFTMGNTANQAIINMINGTAYYDYAFIDSGAITPAQQLQNPYHKTFPIAAVAVVPQINLVNITPFTSINISREALAGIFMGDITNWQDYRIAFTNPGLRLCQTPPFNPPQPCLINANITVIYRNDSQPLNVLWARNMAAFNSSWITRFGAPNLAFPAALKKLPNFLPVVGSLMPNAQGLVTKNSIGYTGYNLAIRDPQIQVASMVNKYGIAVHPDAAAVARAADFLQIGDDLKVDYVIDPDDPQAFPWVAILQIMVPTNFSVDRCEQQKTLYRFVKWILTSPDAQTIVANGGFAPLTVKFQEKILAVLETVTCGQGASAQSLLAVTPIVQRNDAHVFLLVFTTIVLILVLILTGTHLYLFQTSRINMVYSLIFVLGALITLTAPYAWYVVPTQTRICQSRVWLTSVGLSVLLGTMFSRTWQLREIFLLQSKKLEDIKRNTTARSSLIKLSITLSVVVFLNLLILIIWTAVDPYRASYQIVDSLRLTGSWSCVSSNLSTWLLLQCAFLLCTIAFGVYVIYYTWSFQKKSLIEETRWVLIALYNIVVNLTAVIPVVSIANVTESDLAIIITVSLLFSGGGIIFAFLLPRTIKGLFTSGDDSTHDSHKTKPTHQGSHHETSSVHRKDTVESPSHGGSPRQDVRIGDYEKKDTQLELLALRPTQETGKDDPVSQQSTADELTGSLRPLLTSRTEEVIPQSPSPSKMDLHVPNSSSEDFSGSLNWSPNPLSSPSASSPDVIPE